MTHYGIAEWVDFARALAPQAQRSLMQEHLAAGCEECRDSVDFCKKLAGTSGAMTAYQVPDALLRVAYGIFPTPVSSRLKRSLRVPVELIFDSFLSPSPVGLRATWQVGWQGLYRAGDCSVDLRIEPDLASSRAAVIGQISNHVAPEVEMADLPVCLKQGKLVLAEGRSNRFGEFQLEYEQQSRVYLCIYLDRGSKCIQVPIKRLVSDKRTGGGVKSGGNDGLASS